MFVYVKQTKQNTFFPLSKLDSFISRTETHFYHLVAEMLIIFVFRAESFRQVPRNSACRNSLTVHRLETQIKGLLKLSNGTCKCEKLKR